MVDAYADITWINNLNDQKKAFALNRFQLFSVQIITIKIKYDIEVLTHENCISSFF